MIPLSLFLREIPVKAHGVATLLRPACLGRAHGPWGTAPALPVPRPWPGLCSPAGGTAKSTWVCHLFVVTLLQEQGEAIQLLLCGPIRLVPLHSICPLPCSGVAESPSRDLGRPPAGLPVAEWPQLTASSTLSPALL